MQDMFNPEYAVSRYQAKKNMNLIGEITKRLKGYDYLFDKYWYV